MSAAGSTAGGGDVPQAKVVRKGGFSLIWLIPIVAAIAGVWLVWTTFASRGPTITITLQSASGIEPGKTPIKYRDVQLGVVQTVELTDDLQHVVATARMNKGVEKELRQQTQFWIESARITAAGVSGLSTLLSGVYIGMRPGPGEPARAFVALESAPVYQVDVPGRHFTLRTKTLGSISAGAPIYFRGIQVGGILGYDLDPTGAGIDLFAFVRSPYDAFVRPGSHFWNASGIDVSVTGGGVDVRTESLVSVLSGGIAFDTPLEASDGPAAEENATFPLFHSRDAIEQAKFTLKVSFRMYFDDSVSGLDVGASVVYRGIKLGEVTDVHLEVDPKTLQARIPVTIALEPQRWVVKGGTTVQTATQLVDRVGKAVADASLRGQMQSGNLLTGERLISLQMFPDAPKATLTFDEDGVPIIPTVPSDIQVLTDKVNSFLNKLDKAPVAELVTDLRNTVQQADRLLASASVRQGVDSLKDVGPLLESLRRTSDSARATLDRTEATLQSASQAIGPDSAVRYDLAALLQELTSAARSLRALADFLERNPNALILGKPTP